MDEKATAALVTRTDPAGDRSLLGESLEAPEIHPRRRRMLLLHAIGFSCGSKTLPLAVEGEWVGLQRDDAGVRSRPAWRSAAGP